MGVRRRHSTSVPKMRHELPLRVAPILSERKTRAGQRADDEAMGTSEAQDLRAGPVAATDLDLTADSKGVPAAKDASMGRRSLVALLEVQERVLNRGDLRKRLFDDIVIETDGDGWMGGGTGHRRCSSSSADYLSGGSCELFRGSSLGDGADCKAMEASRASANRAGGSVRLLYNLITGALVVLGFVRDEEQAQVQELRIRVPDTTELVLEHGEHGEEGEEGEEGEDGFNSVDGEASLAGSDGSVCSSPRLAQSEPRRTRGESFTEFFIPMVSSLGRRHSFPPDRIGTRDANASVPSAEAASAKKAWEWNTSILGRGLSLGDSSSAAGWQTEIELRNLRLRSIGRSHASAVEISGDASGSSRLIRRAHTERALLPWQIEERGQRLDGRRSPLGRTASSAEGADQPARGGPAASATNPLETGLGSSDDSAGLEQPTISDVEEATERTVEVPSRWGQDDALVPDAGRAGPEDELFIDMLGGGGWNIPPGTQMRARPYAFAVFLRAIDFCGLVGFLFVTYEVFSIYLEQASWGDAAALSLGGDGVGVSGFASLDNLSFSEFLPASLKSELGAIASLGLQSAPLPPMLHSSLLASVQSMLGNALGYGYYDFVWLLSLLCYVGVLGQFALRCMRLPAHARQYYQLGRVVHGSISNAEAPAFIEGILTSRAREASRLLGLVLVGLKVMCAATILLTPCGLPGYTRLLSICSVNILETGLRGAAIVAMLCYVRSAATQHVVQARPGLTKAELGKLPELIYRGPLCQPVPLGNTDAHDKALAPLCAEAMCSICLSPYEEDDRYVHVPCPGNHAFHSECITRWLGRCARCPLCQADVRESLPKATSAC